ncbi:hypothetical protein TNCV_3057851 [Trichonephila clavipes]|nr:hypothetical protein TNCV_3057851 [Trichonephila clavipes]
MPRRWGQVTSCRKLINASCNGDVSLPAGGFRRKEGAQSAEQDDIADDRLNQSGIQMYDCETRPTSGLLQRHISSNKHRSSARVAGPLIGRGDAHLGRAT